MIESIRTRLVLSQEGQWIAMASNYGDDGEALIRCVVDGAMNALMRVGGPQAAAEYSFQLSDRIVGKLRLPTDLPVAKVEPLVVINEAPKPVIALPPPTPAPSPMRFWSIFAIGWLCGLAMGIGTR